MPYSNEILGGLLIGLGSALPLLFEGRIAGISGYSATAIRPSNKDGKTALALVLGLILGGLIWKILGNEIPLTESLQLHTFVWAIAGLLVGFGSRLAGGCTSGHGVCGLGRASPRSFVAVLIFMSVAILTTLAMRTIK
jgi:uncharacterized membrane protein YedE/YeeE